MIKEGKDKQREKNGSTTTVKTELPSSQGQTSETTVKEEPGTESHVNGGEEGDNSCKKNGVRVSGGNGATGSSSSCSHADIKPSLIGSTNTGTVTMGPVRSSSATHITSDLCMVDGAQEATKSEESSSQDKPASCSTVKTEINGSTNHEFSNTDPCNEGNVSMGISLSNSGPPPNGVQPLPSNVINKQPGTMEAQYMQQQSQIFVFSTALANKSAEAVLQGQFPSIIAYHCAQPGTKKYLEKHPLKMNQFNRQNPAQWLNSLAQMKQKAGPGVMKGLNPGGVQGDMGANPNSGGGMGIWNQNNSMMNNINAVGNAANSIMQQCSNSVLAGCPVSSSITQGSGTMKTPGIDSPCMMPGSPNANPMMSGTMGHHSPSIPSSNPAMMQGGAPDIAGSPIMNPNSNVPQPTLTGVKVPDENLTPQQRQHREEQLATLRKMQQMLFPEHQSPIPEGGNVGQPSEGMLMQHGIGPMMGMGPGPGPGSGPAGMNNNGNTGVMPQKGIMMGGLGGPNQITPTSVAAQIEWQKLQHQFYEERKKKGPSGLVMGGSGSGIGSPAGPTIQQMGASGPGSCGPGPCGPGPCGPGSCGPGSCGPGSCGPRAPGTSGGGTGTVQGPGSGGSGPRAQGPPPPYHQTTRSASVPNAMPSPNPSSPNNPTSNLSLPSPRAASGLNSPADPNRQQFPIGGNGNGNGGSSTRLVGSGPSPTGTHNTSLESPSASRPLNLSNPSTPVSTHLSPSAARKESSSEFTSLTPGSSSQPNTTTSNQQPTVDGMYCRTLQSMAQQKQQQQPNQPNKEPNLMPVPSPQQIQYLNTFDGQELTIQKQPNTSLKDSNIRSPTLPPPSLDSSLQTSASDMTGARISGPGTPLTPTSMEVGSRFPPTTGEISRFPIPSPHTPGAPGTTETKNQSQRFPGPSPQNQGSLTPVMDPLNKAPTTEVGSRFLSSSPQMVDGMGPPRMPAPGSGPASTSPAVTNPTQNFMQQTTPTMGGMKVTSHFLEVSPSGNTSSAIEVSPTGSGSFPCMRSENVPLNPNGSGGMPCNGKSAHFDPITSMAQMSQQLTSSVANSPGSQNPGLMNSIPGGMLPFNSNMHPMQMNEMSSCQGLQDGQTSGGGLMNTMGPGVPGNQPGPTNFVGMPIQNAPPHSYSPNSSVSGGMVQCSGSVNTTPSMNQPIMHANSSASPKPGNMIMGLGPSRGSSPYTSSPVPQRMIGRPPGPNPYSGTNVQVKASAPNTIQYLPAKPQTGSSGPRGPPSLDFLQRFTSPLSNLDTKVPTHNLQYFPTSGQPNPGNMGRLNVPMNRPNGAMSDVNSQIGGLPGTNCGSVGGHMGGLNGPIIGSNVSLVGMNLPMAGGMVMGPGGPGVGMSPLRGSLRPGGMMRMQQMGGSVFGLPSSPGQPVGGEQLFVGGPSQNMAGNAQNTQMFVPGSKSSPMGLGSTPDASQPLPPSMGQANNFKNSPFIGPTTADPNYAQQFHNFQQQLYATNTRSQMTNQGMVPNQAYFVPK